ncbi:RNA 2',3'-cyclic phosphodiesterase [Kibdelosporangium lantanae]
MRLFTAAVPPAHVADHLAAFLAGAPDLDYWAPREAWHITIGYYGPEDDVEGRSAWVRDRLPGLKPARVSLRDTGNFGETQLIMVSTSDSALHDLAAALRWNDKHPTYNPHLTIGRGRPLGLPYEGPEWTVDEIVLLGAERRHDYTVLDRYRLG